VNRLLPFLLLTAMVSATASAAIAPPENMKLFLLIGQSNMAGRGAVGAEEKVVHPRVFALNKQLEWVPAVDPLHWDKPDVAGVGLGSTFGRVVADANPNATVGLIPAAFGGTSLDQWAIGGELYTNAVKRAKQAMQHGRLAGILWHQGESDSGPGNDKKVASYTERFSRMIAQLRADLDAQDVPVIVGELGHFRVNDASGPLNAVLAKLPESVPLCACVSADGLADKGDKLHFDTPSLKEFGRRYAAAWTKLARTATK
jgi:hypothetical protein